MESRVGPPSRRPAGRGGIYSTTASGDPFFDAWDDTPERIIQLVIRLAEAPMVRPHLQQFGLYYGQRERDGLLGLRCDACRPHGCACGTMGQRANEYMVECFRDPDLRPLFDELKLAVRE